MTCVCKHGLKALFTNKWGVLSRNIQGNGNSLSWPWTVTMTCSYKNWKPPREIPEVDFPFEKRKLRFIERTPQPLPMFGKHLKMPKRLMDMRGPEEINNYLLHRQYGIRAITGGKMHWGHFDMIRLTINRKMDEKRMFAIWRLDSPWKPITKKGQGHRMGGGKGAIDKFVTPLKSGSIIVEMGGTCTYGEVFPILDQLARKLPFKAEVVNQEMLDAEKQREEFVEKNNLNPFTFKYCLEKNMLGCKVWAGPYDYFWHGKHR